MFSNTDYSVLSPSDNAARNYRLLRIFDIAVLLLLVVGLVLVVWNFWYVFSAVGANAPDLADMHYATHTTQARALMFLAPITLVLVIFKEWKWGDIDLKSFWMLIAIGAMWLMPAFGKEFLPDEQHNDIGVNIMTCSPGTLGSGAQFAKEDCTPDAISGDDVRLAYANPEDGDVELHQPDSSSNNSANWGVTGQGNYSVYFLLRRDSMDACENTTIFAESRTSSDFACIERDGTVWLSYTFESRNRVQPLLNIFVDPGEEP